MINLDQLKDTKKAAKYLLGKELVLNDYKGIIIETEAYLYNDPSCHAYRGITERNKSMFEDAGRIYVYLIYGMYNCINIVTNSKNIGEAVLIRSIFPTNGIDKMTQNRNTQNIKNLCSGPGKICQAFNITKKYNNTLLGEYITINDTNIKGKIIYDYRIGVHEEKPKKLRFYLEKYKDFVSVVKK